MWVLETDGTIELCECEFQAAQHISPLSIAAVADSWNLLQRDHDHAISQRLVTFP